MKVDFLRNQLHIFSRTADCCLLCYKGAKFQMCPKQASGQARCQPLLFMNITRKTFFPKKTSCHNFFWQNFWRWWASKSWWKSSLSLFVQTTKLKTQKTSSNIELLWNISQIPEWIKNFAKQNTGTHQLDIRIFFFLFCVKVDGKVNNYCNKHSEQNFTAKQKKKKKLSWWKRKNFQLTFSFPMVGTSYPFLWSQQFLLLLQVRLWGFVWIALLLESEKIPSRQLDDALDPTVNPVALYGTQ